MTLDYCARCGKERYVLFNVPDSCEKYICFRCLCFVNPSYALEVIKKEIAYNDELDLEGKEDGKEKNGTTSSPLFDDFNDAFET